jgi:hypothetical protein
MKFQGDALRGLAPNVEIWAGWSPELPILKFWWTNWYWNRLILMCFNFTLKILLHLWYEYIFVFHSCDVDFYVYQSTEFLNETNLWPKLFSTDLGQTIQQIPTKNKQSKTKRHSVCRLFCAYQVRNKISSHYFNVGESCLYYFFQLTFIESNYSLSLSLAPPSHLSYIFMFWYVIQQKQSSCYLITVLYLPSSSHELYDLQPWNVVTSHSYLQRNIRS